MTHLTHTTLVERMLSQRAREVRHGSPRQTSIPMSGMITLSAGTPDFPTPRHIIDAAKRALDDRHTTYTEWAGIPELRRAIADKLTRHNNLTINRTRG